MTVISSRIRLGILYLVPSSLFLLFFFYFPTWIIFKLAFSASVTQVKSIFSNSLFSLFFQFTILQSIFTVLLSVLIGMPTAYWLARTKPYGITFLRTLLTVPFLFPPLVIILGFVILFESHGLLITVFNITFNPFSFWGIVVAHIMYNISVVTRILESSFISEPFAYHEIALVSGASRYKRFRTITIPHLLPSLKAAILLVFLYSFNSFAVVLLLGQVKLQTIEVMIYSQSRIRFNTTTAAVLAVFQLLVNLVVILWYSDIKLPTTPLYRIFSRLKHQLKNLFLWSQNKQLIRDTSAYNVISTTQIDKTFIMSHEDFPRSSSRIMPTLGIFVVIFFTWVPAISVIFNTIRLYLTASDQIREQFVSGYYDRFLGVSTGRVMSNTLFFGITVAVISLIFSLSVIIAVYLFRDRKSIEKFFAVVTILPMATSAVTLSFALLTSYGGLNWYNNGVWVFIIASHIMAALPFTFRVVLSSWQRVNPEILEVADTLGSTHYRSLRYLVLPYLKSSVIVAFLFAFAISIGEFGATFYLARGEWITLSLAIEKMFTTRLALLPNLYATILVVFSTMTLFMIERAGRLELKV